MRMETQSYAADGTDLKANGLPSSFPSGPIQSQTILLTGATGFLGTGILVKLLELSSKIRIIALVRAKSDSDALARIKTSCTAYHHWSKSWSSRIRCIPADLSQDKLGVSAEVWHSLQGDVDIIIHNAAIVHWIKTYAVLKPTNVLSTLSLLTLCSVGKPKHFTFVSSTAVLDSENMTSLPCSNPTTFPAVIQASQTATRRPSTSPNILCAKQAKEACDARSFDQAT